MDRQVIVLELWATVLGGALFILGLKVLTKRAFFVGRRLILLFITIALLPFVLGPIWRTLDYELRTPSLWLALLPVPIFVTLFLFVRKTLGNVTVFNVTEDTLYDSLSEALSKNDIAYDQKRSQIVLKGVDSSVKISIQAMTSTASLAFIGPENIPNLERVLKDFRTSLLEKEFAGRPMSQSLF